MNQKKFFRTFRYCSCKKESIRHLLESEGFVIEPEDFSDICARAVYEPFPLGSSIAALFGLIYIQDKSSMLPCLALPKNCGFYLDMCASPGSKTGLLATLAGNESAVLANEPNSQRLATLRANLLRTNIFNCITSSMPAQSLSLPDNFCPAILLDPPCSGWGTSQKNPSALKIWQGAKIEPLIALQQKLLIKAASMLKQGGFLVYSTCTTNHKENEEQTLFAVEKLGLESIALPHYAGFVFDENTARIGALLVKGNESESQGFYISLLKKPGKLDREEIAQPEKKQTFHAADSFMLETPVFSPKKLPPGIIAKFGDKLRFLPEKAVLLPENLRWQGTFLGDIRQNGQFNPNKYLRSLLPEDADAPKIILEDIKDIKKILQGQTIKTDSSEKTVALWWKSLPLSAARIKGGRICCDWQTPGC